MSNATKEAPPIPLAAVESNQLKAIGHDPARGLECQKFETAPQVQHLPPDDTEGGAL